MRPAFRRALLVAGAALLLPHPAIPGAAAQLPDTRPAPAPVPAPPMDTVPSVAARPDTLPRDTAPRQAESADTAEVAPLPLWPEALERAFVPIGSADDDRLRVMQLLGQAPTTGYLVRSALRHPAGAGFERNGIAPVEPELRTVWNSKIPYSMNDGAMWAGAGTSFAATAGVRARWGRVSAVLAPQAVYQQNAEFDFIPQSQRQFSEYAFPWHFGPESIDYPSRFGPEAFWTVDWGQSRLAVDLGPAQLGASAENLWWGPGLRNAIVMSNHAGGIPHFFLSTGRPIRTPLGALEGRWMVGALAESAYFDTLSGNGDRSISALALTLQPAEGLTLGLARAVYRPIDGGLFSAGTRLFDVFTDVGRPNTRPSTDPEREEGPDQVASLFGRWVLPADGLEVYAEWARHERPRSLRDLLVDPEHTQGYTLGGQYARPVGAERIFRLQAELSYLELSSTIRYRNVATWYTSRPVRQGYTQEGQVIGAAIGPGASSQWAAADLLSRGWSLGLFLGRVRWDNDAMYQARLLPLPYGHDVSVLGGLRGTVRLRGWELGAEYTGATRYNYLYQFLSTSFEDIRGIDLRNHTLRLSLTPVAW